MKMGELYKAQTELRNGTERREWNKVQTEPNKRRGHGEYRRYEEQNRRE
jgi:hypothetical protein